MLFTTGFPSELVRIEGALDLERTGRGLRPRRLPGWTRPQLPDPMMDLMVRCTAGVRLVLRTEATRLALTLHVVRMALPFGPAPAVLDLLADGELLRRVPVRGGDLLRFTTGTGQPELLPGATETVRFVDLPPGRKELELWLPQTAGCDLVALTADAPVSPGRVSRRPHWVHYGSSVSHGMEAEGPSGTWPAVAAAAAGLRLTGLGFSGNAVLDPFVARSIRDLPADLISLKIGANIVDGVSMRLRTFLPAVHGFLDTIREGQPDTPVLVVSPICCPALEDCPGPTVPDPRTGVRRSVGDPAETALGALTLSTVREQLELLVRERARSDSALSYLDGRRLLGPDETAALCDGLHPDAAAHQRMGVRFADCLRDAGLPGPG
jgi:GDSL-like Lipase/Acylhydrolase family